jgi:hypothetical protein
MDGSHDWKTKQKAMLEGVVNLKDTVDTDKDVTVAQGELRPTQWLRYV